MEDEHHSRGPARLLAAAAVVAVAVHLFGLYRPTGPPSPGWLPDADKLEHVAGFAAPVALLLLSWLYAAPAGVRRLPGRPGVVVPAVFAAHALVSELVQHTFYRYRTGDPADVLADLSGVALGYAVAVLTGRWRVTRARPAVARVRT